jgi:hypothetical protein
VIAPFGAHRRPRRRRTRHPRMRLTREPFCPHISIGLTSQTSRRTRQ